LAADYNNVARVFYNTSYANFYNKGVYASRLDTRNWHNVGKL